jgi:hypothetical protein
MGHDGLRLQNLEEALRFAEGLVRAKIGPKGATAGGIVALIQAGAELGFPPMASLRNFAVINGLVAPMTRAAKATIKRREALLQGSIIEEWLEVDGERVEEFPEDFKGRKVVAYCKSQRIDEDTPVVHSFSWAQAKRAGLDRKAGPWQEFPERMLGHRARGFHFDDQFSQELLGMTIAEALEDYGADEPTERDVTPAPVAAPALPAGESDSGWDDTVPDEEPTASAAAEAVLGDLSGAPTIDSDFGPTPAEEPGEVPDDSAPQSDIPDEHGSAGRPLSESGSTTSAPDEPRVGFGDLERDEMGVCAYCEETVFVNEGRLWRNKLYHNEHTPPATKKAEAETAPQDPQEPEPEAPKVTEPDDIHGDKPRIGEQKADALRVAIRHRAEQFNLIPDAAEHAPASIEAQVLRKGQIARLEHLPEEMYDPCCAYVQNAKYVPLDEIAK